MSDKAPKITEEVAEDGSTVHVDETGTVLKIVSPLGKQYTPKNLSAKADAELVKRVEDFRWPNQLTVAEFVLLAVTSYLDAQGTPKA